MTEGDQKQNRADRLKLAARIVELSNQVLSTKQNKDYIALQIGTPPNCNAVIVSDDDYVKFLVRSTNRAEEFIDRAKTEGGFTPDKPKWRGEWRGSCRFWGLGLNDLQTHEGLFRDMVEQSVNSLKALRQDGKNR